MTMTAALSVSLSQGRFAVPARAEDANSPLAIVQSTVNQALEVLRDQQAPLPERQQKLRQIVAGTFDFTEMAKSALGYHWKQLSPQQQQEFTTVFISFIEDSYLSKINDYRGQQVSFLRASNDGPEEAQVNTDIVQQGRDPIHVNYRLMRKGAT